MTVTSGSTRAVLYARVSSKDQEREGFSIPSQLKLLRQYAREQHLTIVREFVDVETAKQAGRGGFGEMILALKNDASCRTILVEKTDRLYRNIKDWMTSTISTSRFISSRKTRWFRAPRARPTSSSTASRC